MKRTEIEEEFRAMNQRAEKVPTVQEIDPRLIPNQKRDLGSRTRVAKGTNQ